MNDYCFNKGNFRLNKRKGIKKTYSTKIKRTKAQINVKTNKQNESD